MPEENENLNITLPVRRLVEFLLQSGSIDSRFTGFDRANEGSRIHRKLQKAAVHEHADYAAEVALKQSYVCEGVNYCIEGRADGIFTEDGITVIDEIKTTTLPEEMITEDHSPAHWAQGYVYAAIYAMQNELPRMRIRLTYYQVDEERIIRFSHEKTSQELEEYVKKLLTEYAPWAKRAANWKTASRTSLQALAFPFSEYRPGQKAMISAVYRCCADGGQLLCQAPTGIGKTMSVLFPALKAVGGGVQGPIFYLTARTTTRTAAENALHLLHKTSPQLKLRGLTLTAKDKICLCDTRECTPQACPYANGYHDRIKEALWDALDADTLDPETLHQYARKHTVCPFELGLDLSLWCDVIIGDYNYLFDPVVRLQRFFDSPGDFLFLIDEAHNLPGRARDMHTATLQKSSFFEAKKLLGRSKSSLKNALSKVNNIFIEWRHLCEEAALSSSSAGKTYFSHSRSEDFDHALSRLCEQLERWLEDHREPDETHTAMLQLYFDARAWLRVAESFDDHYVFQVSAYGSEVRATLLCLDPSAFLAADFALGRAAVLFSATLAPAGYYKDLCGLPDARAVALKSPFTQSHLGLYCAHSVSTRYKDRENSILTLPAYLATMVQAHAGNYIAFFPSYSYMRQVLEAFTDAYPTIPTLCQESGMDEAQKEEFLAHFSPDTTDSLLGFAVQGGVFGEGVDLAGNRLIGVAIIGPGLPQVGARQNQLRDYFEKTRGSGFDYAYRFPGMNKVLQAAGRVIRTPEDKGVVLLIDSRFATADYQRLMPPHWDHLQYTATVDALREQLAAFWGNPQQHATSTQE